MAAQGSPPPYDPNPEALLTDAGLEPEVVVPGHGVPTDIDEVTKYTKDYLVFLRGEVQKLLDDGGTLIVVRGNQAPDDGFDGKRIIAHGTCAHLGGIVGLATAYRLSQEYPVDQLHITIVEKEAAVALGEQRLMARPEGTRRALELAALYSLAGLDGKAIEQLQWIADNADLAESSGIDVNRVILVTWLVGAGLAGSWGRSSLAGAPVSSSGTSSRAAPRLRDPAGFAALRARLFLAGFSSSSSPSSSPA